MAQGGEQESGCPSELEQCVNLTVELDLKQKARLRNVHPKPSEMGILEKRVTQDWFGESDTLGSWALCQAHLQQSWPARLNRQLQQRNH